MTEAFSHKFTVGETVERLSNVFDVNSEMMYGIVAKGPYSFQNFIGFYDECYDVLWQGRPMGKGYFPYGIEASMKPVAS